MKTSSIAVIAAGAALLLGGCVSMPNGPGVMVLPGSGKNFDQFRADDMECRQFASSQVGGGTPDGSAENSALKSAAVGTAVGAAAGALLGGHSGAGSGAAAGLIVGSAAGAGSAGASQRTLQQRYDIGYTQCMYAKGHKIPTAGRYETTRPPVSSYTPSYNPPPPPPASYAPPPPSGAYAPPPPPPGTN